VSVVHVLEAEDSIISLVALPLKQSLETGIKRLPHHTNKHYYSSAAYSTTYTGYEWPTPIHPPFAAGDLISHCQMTLSFSEPAFPGKYLIPVEQKGSQIYKSPSSSAVPVRALEYWAKKKSSSFHPNRLSMHATFPATLSKRA
jgi:hypothetical protein